MLFRLRYTMFIDYFFSLFGGIAKKSIFPSWKITHFSEPDVVEIRPKSLFFSLKMSPFLSLIFIYTFLECQIIHIWSINFGNMSTTTQLSRGLLQPIFTGTEIMEWFSVVPSYIAKNVKGQTVSPIIGAMEVKNLSSLDFVRMCKNKSKNEWKNNNINK